MAWKHIHRIADMNVGDMFDKADFDRTLLFVVDMARNLAADAKEVSDCWLCKCLLDARGFRRLCWCLASPRPCF